MRPVRGSSRPSSPASWAVNQTVPPGAGATSCGCAPAKTGNSRSVVRGRRAGGTARPATVAAGAVAVSRASGPPSDPEPQPPSAARAASASPRSHRPGTPARIVPGRWTGSAAGHGLSRQLMAGPEPDLGLPPEPARGPGGGSKCSARSSTAHPWRYVGGHGTRPARPPSAERGPPRGCPMASEGDMPTSTTTAHRARSMLPARLRQRG